jgi:hypothetical protein
MTDTELLKKIFDNCIKDADCLLWQGNTNPNGLPVRKNKSLRRVVWRITRGELSPQQLVTVKCEHENCLGCLALTTKSKAAIKANKPLDVRMRRRLSLQATKRAASPITIDTVREIRASHESLAVLETRYGITKAMASKIRLNRVWREHASPFTGLGAR